MRQKPNSINKIKLLVAEEFRILRTNIHFSAVGGEVKSIVVTSSMPGEGKTTVISNLAVTIAHAGKRVVIVDCDLRRPVVHKKFSLSNSQGLTNILVQDKKKTEIISETNVPNLYVITSGPTPPNPSELLGSKIMKAVLDELINIFDVVLIDTPPVLHIADAQILSAIAQGTILVAAYGKAEKKGLMNAKEKIEKVGGKILGVVINKIPETYNNTYEYY